MATGDGSLLFLQGAAVNEIASGTTVQLSGSGSAIEVVSQASDDAVAIEQSLLTVDQGAALQVLGARDYTTTNALTIDGSLTLGGGTFSAGPISGGASSSISGFGTFAANLTDYGRVTASSGQTLSFTGTNVFYGTLLGSGTDQIAGGSDEFDPGARLAVASLALTGGSMTLRTNLGYKGAFSMSAGTLYLNGQTLTLTGSDGFSGGTVYSYGTLALKGSTAVSGRGWSLAHKARLINSATVNAVGDLTLGDSAEFINNAGATYTFDGAGSAGILVTADGGAGPVYNRGTIQEAATASSLSTISAALVNTGAITAASSAGLKLAGGVIGTGTISIKGEGMLEIAGAVARTQALSFADGADGTLLLDHGQRFGGTVAGFVAGDTLDFGGVASSGARVVYRANANNTGGTLTVVSGTDHASLTLDGQFLASSFHVAADASGTGTAVTYTPPANLSHLSAAHA